MKTLSILATLMVVAMLVFGIGGIWFLTHLPTGELLALNQEIAIKQAEIELLQAKQEYTQSYVQAQRDLQRLELQQDIEAGTLYQASKALSHSVMNLWPVWFIVSIGAVIWQQKHRWIPQVEFAFDGIQTTIPSQQAVRLTEQAIKAKELESSSKILAFEEDVSRKRLRETVSAFRALKGIVPNERSVDVVDVTPEAIPAFTGSVYLSQLILDSDYEPGLIPYGRAMDTGNLVQIDWETRKTCLKLGEPGTGKTMGAKAEIWAALVGKYEQQQPIRLHIIDAHYGFKQSLATDLRDYLSLFDSCVLGKEVLTGATLDFLQQMIDEAEAFQASGRGDLEYLDLIWFDEMNETIDEADDGKLIEKAVKRLVNLRKAGKYLSLNMYDGSKGNQSNKGLNPAKMACSQMVYRTTEHQAGAVLGWHEKAIIKQVPHLQQGQCVLHIPDADGALTLVQTALVSDADFYRFAKYAQASQAERMTDDMEAKAADNQARSVTPERVKEYIERTEELSQNKFAKLVDIPKSTLSNFLNGKGDLSAVQMAAIAAILSPQSQKIISFEQVRARLQNQA